MRTDKKIAIGVVNHSTAAFYTCVGINLGANIVRRELERPEVEIPAADPRRTFAG